MNQIKNFVQIYYCRVIDKSSCKMNLLIFYLQRIRLSKWAENQ